MRGNSSLLGKGIALFFVLLMLLSGVASAAYPVPAVDSTVTNTSADTETDHAVQQDQTREQRDGEKGPPDEPPGQSDDENPGDGGPPDEPPGRSDDENPVKGEDGPGSAGVTRIDSCRVIDSPGKYLVTTDIFSSGEGPCIQITSSNVDLNGARYRITGDQSMSGASQVGVLVGQVGPNTETLTDVTVKNVIVSGWTDGIRLTNTERSEIQNNILNGNYVGISLYGGDTTDVRVRGNTLTGNSRAIEVQHANRNVLFNNHISNNLDGIRLSNASENQVQQNEILENHQYGILLRRASSRNTITRNQIGNNERSDTAEEREPNRTEEREPNRTEEGEDERENVLSGASGVSLSRDGSDRQYKIRLSRDSIENTIEQNTLLVESGAGESSSRSLAGQILSEADSGTNAITGNEILADQHTDGPLPSFSSTGLQGANIENPTSLQFGPDDRLYVATQSGTIYAFTVERNSATDYQVTDTEVIDEITEDIPNHDDDGSLNTSVTERLITGIYVTGTAENPVLYVGSSDPRIGGGSTGKDTALDTNSGVLSRLQWNGTAWNHTQLVRGLPRSEENHAINGLQLDEQNGTLYAAMGGNTNKGAPSNNFAYLPEYALSAAVISIDLAAIGNSTYDIPTLNNTATPFGGQSGDNQAKIVEGGPVQVYSPGYRNPYDLVLTEDGQLYTVDNGANSGWGGPPTNEGPEGVCTNEPNEDNSSTDQDGLHYISGEGYYGGHPAPVRGNPDGSGYPGAVPSANPIECDYQDPADDPDTLVQFSSSTNGLDEYTASNFDNSLQGDLLAASFGGDIWRIQLNSAGDDVVSKTSLFSNFGSTPLDVTTQGDNDLYGGTVWAATYGSNDITVFEPTDENVGCIGSDVPHLDEDGDGFSNADEIDNGANPCSSASVPPDTDGDKLSNLNDYDDDDDGMSDIVDPFAIDADNGQSLPVSYQFVPGSYEGTILDLGFTGLMTNGVDDYQTLYDPGKLTAGGAANVLSVDEISEGSAYQTLNDQEYAFQFGVYPENEPFTAHTTINSPFPEDGGTTPVDSQSQGLYIGTGDQSNFIKLVASANGGTGGVHFAKEEADSFSTIEKPDDPNVTGSGRTIDFYLDVDPQNDTVTARYTVDGGAEVVVGTTTLPDGWADQSNRGLAVGVISTSRGPGDVFPGTWTQLEALPEDRFPTASFTYSPSSPTTEDTITFDASGSSDPEGPIASYEWDFNSDGTVDATGEQVTHSYATSGDKSVTLTVTDSKGQSRSMSQTVTVSQPTDSVTQATDISITPNSGINESTYGTDSFNITNTGDGNISAVTLDLSTGVLPDMVFDPNGTAGDKASKGFTVDTEGGTGQSSHTFLSPHDGDADDGYDALRVEFTDFDPGETFTFSVDIDPTSVKGVSAPGPEESASVSGLELARSTITVEFDDGTTQVTTPYSDGSPGGAQAVSKPGLATAPGLSVSGVDLSSTTLSPAHSAATVNDAAQTMTVTGPPGETVRLLRVEAGLFTDEVPNGGYDLEAYESNSITAVEETTGTIGSDGTVDLDVSLTRTSDDADLNYFVAVVEGNAGDTGRVSNVVVLEYDDAAVNDAPVASFTSSPASPAPGETVTLDASGSSDADGTIASYEWDFDGDGTVDSTGETVTTSYATAGDKTVTLTVTDDDGATASTSQSVVVTDSTGYTETTISTCQVLDSPGMYTLSADITNSSAKPCIQITSSDVVLDGAGYTIDGSESANSSDHKGVYVGQTGLNPETITNVTVTNLVASDWNTGIFLERVTDSTVSETTVIENQIGIHLFGANGNSGHTVVDTTGTVNDRAILLEGTQSSTIQRGSLSDNRVGVELRQASSNTVSDITANTSTDAGISLVSSGPTNTVNNVTLDGTTVDLEGENVALGTVVSEPPGPLGKPSIDRYVDVTSTGPNTAVDLRMYYADEDVTQLNESTLRMWRYDGAWSPVSGTNEVDEAGNYVFTSTTQVGVFAPVGSLDTVYRVNTGGSGISTLSGSQDWSADTKADPSPYVNTDTAGNQTYSVADSITLGSSVPSGTPTEVFQTERYDPGSGAEMQWDFPVQSGETYEVRLYFAEIFETSDGQREFDVSVEGNLVLDNYDIHADVGHDTGTMKSFTVTPSDSNLDVDFNQVTGSPKISAIEIVRTDGAANTPPTASFTYSPTSPAPGETITFDASGSSDPDGTIASYEWDFDGDGTTDATGQSVTTTYSTTGDETVTLTVTDNESATDSTSQTVTVSDSTTPTSAAYRVNTGGVQVSATDDDIDWSIDTNSNPSSYSNVGASGSKAYSTADPITLTSSVPSSTPASVFQSERYDPTSGEEMQWDFPVQSGETYEVRLYFAEIYETADGQREFDVSVEGNLVLDNYDIHADVGHDTGTMKSFTVTPSDSNLDIDFGQVTDKPKVSAIEIVPVDGTSNTPPTASFTYSPTSPAPGESITFDASGSSDSDGTIESYEWDFDGDGTTDATGQSVTTSYSSTGDKTVSLTVTDNESATDSTSQTVTVSDGNAAPTASFSYSPTSPAPGETITFDGSGSSDSDGTIESYEWDFDGDGTTDATGEEVTTNYSTTGDKTVSLTVTDNESATDSTTQTVTVSDSNSAPTASFSYSPTSPAPGETVTFDASGSSDSDGTIASYEWDFDGDGTTDATGESVTTSYSTTGDKTVTLTVTDNESAIDTTSQTVTVSDSTTTTSAAYRVNTGGVQVSATDGDIDWSIDTNSNPSSYSNTGTADSKAYSTGDSVTLTSSVPSSTPAIVFQSERYDLSSGEEMQWDFPVQSGETYEVRLYFAEVYETTDGAREFDVSIENDLVLDNYDIHADVGHDTGVMKSFTVTPSDSTLDIDFDHVTNNPKVSAIEVVSTTSTDNTAPTASFTYSPTSPAPDETITFDASGSSDSDGTIESYEWDFDGDGTTDATGETVTTNYSTAGDKTVALTVTDNESATDSTTQTVTVSTDNAAPTASFTYSPTSPAPDETITFDASGSSDSDGTIESYEWDFDGDGTTDATGETVTTNYSTTGDKTVSLTVTDNESATDSTTQTVTVSDSNSAPTASFSYSPTSPAPGETVTFDASGSSDSDGTIASYEWDFNGDGTTDATGQTVTTSYSTTGDKTVSLTVTDDDSATDSTTQTVTVSDSTTTTSAAYRVNTGGVQVSATDDDIDWSIDTNSNPSSYSNVGTADSNAYSTGDSVTLSSSVPSSTPASVFQSERYDPTSGEEMQWDFPVQSGETYEVRLYFAEIYETADGAREFDVSIENDLVLDNYDIHADVGHDTGVMKSFTVTPSDSTLDIDFDHVTNNPKVSAIEVVSTTSTDNTAPTASFTYSPTSPAPGESITFDASGSSDSDGTIESYEWDFDGDGTPDATGETVTTNYSTTGDKTVTLTVTDNESATDSTTQTVTVSDSNSAPTASFTYSPSSPAPDETITFDASDTSDADGTIASYEWDFDGDGTTDATGETATTSYSTTGDKTVSLTVTDDDGATDSTSQTLTVSDSTTTAESYRVNGGGAQVAAIDSGIDWAADTGSNPSQYTNADTANSNPYSTGNTITLSSSVPSNTPASVFQSERYDLSSGEEMQWDFPVQSGETYEVRLYFAEIYETSDGQREFDVTIEGNLVLDNYDIHADVGHDTGVMKNFTITPDSNLDIDFVHVTQNPKISAIEVIPADGSTSTTSTTSSTTTTTSNVEPTASFTYSPSDPETNETITFNASDSSDSDGTIASYEWDFDEDGAVDATGQSVTYTYSTMGDKSVSLTVTDDAGVTNSTSETVTVSSSTSGKVSVTTFERAAVVP